MAVTTVNVQTERTEKAPEPNTAQARYAALSVGRQAYLDRGRDAAKLTIPSLLPPEGSNGTTKLPQPWQSVGARGLNNLAAKLNLILFPPDGTFFRQTVSDFTMQKLVSRAVDNGEDAKAVRLELEEALGKIERAVAARLEERGYRMQTSEACKQLIVCGNALLQMLPDERLKLHKLDRYVVKRDQQGNVTEIVVCESVAKVTLPVEIQNIIETHSAKEAEKADPSPDVDIYTWIRRTGKRWVVSQEVFGQVIEKSSGTYPIDKSPWMPMRLISVDGEDYGRGFVEENIGDLQSYDSLRQALVEGGAISSRLIPLVDEGGITSIKDINEARNGQAVRGRLRDVEFLKVDKAADLQVTEKVAADVKRDLLQNFLLFAGSQRDAERVTAEEIRAIVQELEVTSLSGSYPVLAQELQRPIAARAMFQMTQRNELPKLPDGVVSLQIVTGIAGIGRNSDLAKLDLVLAGGSELFGPAVVAEYTSPGAYFQHRATALAVDISGVIRSDEDVQKQRDKVMQMEMAKAAIGPVAKLAQQSPEGQPAPGTPPQ